MKFRGFSVKFIHIFLSKHDIRFIEAQADPYIKEYYDGEIHVPSDILQGN